MKIKIIFLLIILTTLSCNEENKPQSITIALGIEQIDNPFPILTSRLLFMDSIPKEFKGITNRDSSYVMYLNYVSTRDIKKALKEGELKQETIDSTETKIYVLSGINKGMQFFIIDLNGNKDFTDDKIVEFEKNISEKDNYRDLFSTQGIEITKFNKKKFYKELTYLQFLPARKYDTSKKQTASETLKNSLKLTARKLDFLYGSFKLENQKFGVGANKGIFGNEFIFKNYDTTFYSPNNQLFAKYKLKDTLRLKGEYFRIDSFSTFPSKLTIKKIEVNGEVYGFRTNDVSKNYQIQNLNGTNTSLQDLAKEKGFLLLDFWGTWCGPCKELTPELVALHKKYKDKLQVASLAFELDPKPVREYTTKNQMNWFNGIIIGKPKSGDMSAPIIGGLRVECYPTFIVLDTDLNILYRTCGGGANYSDLKKFLSSKLE